MKKKLAAAAAAVFVLAGAAYAGADVFDPADGTVTVMASGGTLYEDHTTSAQSVGGGATVATKNVPAGRYQVTAKTWVEDTSGSTNFVQCGVVGLVDSENARATVPANGWATLTVLGSVDLATATDIELFCNAAGSADAEMTVLHAMTVSAIK